MRAADTRMAGYFYAFHRMLRLKDPLVATINSIAFKDYEKKKKKLRDIGAVLNNNDFWIALFEVTRAVFPLLRVLRLADSSKAGMDKLYYFVRMTDKAIEKSVGALDDLKFFEDESGNTMEALFDNDNDDDVDDSKSDEDVGDDGDDGRTDGNEMRDSEDSDNSDNDDFVDDLGKRVESLWKKRRMALVSDYAMTSTCLLFVVLFPAVD